VGPAGDPKLILRALHQRAAEYLDESRLKDGLLAAIVRFKARHLAQPNLRAPGSVIAVLAPSGGSGASTIAVNVATVLAKKHKISALLDLRLSAGDLASLLDLKPSYTLADLCERLPRLDRTMFEQLLTRHSSGVHLLAAPRSFSQLDKVTTNGVRQAVAMARGQFPYVVLDMENTLDESQVETLWQADVILLVMRLDYTSVRNARRTIERLKEMGLDLDRVKLVVNRYGEAKQLRVAEAEEALGMKIFHYVPNNPSRINHAINSGVPVVLQGSWARVARSLGELAHSVNGRHAP
jgi:pilus assembly protein CpaE